MKLYRQGDIWLVPDEVATEGTQKRETKDAYLVAEGEATGHHHTMYPLSRDAVIVEELLGDQRWLDIRGTWEFRHNVHGPHRICPGRYKINLERERNPWRDAIVRVRD